MSARPASELHKISHAKHNQILPDKDYKEIGKSGVYEMPEKIITVVVLMNQATYMTLMI